MVIKERSSGVFPALKNSRTDLSMQIKYYKLSNICSFISILLFGILFFITIGGCTATEETVGTEPEIPIKKKVLFNQEIDGGKNSVSVIEETQGNKRILRVLLQRGDLKSNLIHPIDSPNFVIAVPLQDATSKILTLKTAAFELSLKLYIGQLLSR